MEGNKDHHTPPNEGTSGVDHSGPKLVGAPISVDVNDPNIKELAYGALAQIQSSANKKLRFVRIIGGTVQVVAGMLYDLKLLLAYEQPEGAIDAREVSMVCDVSVWSKAWNDEKVYTVRSCVDSSNI